MKKLICSTFAMSLILLGMNCFAQTESVDDFLGLEAEILPELSGEQRFTGQDFHEQKSWKVDTKQVVIDVPEPVKGQKYSIIPWSTLDPVEWLSVEKWIIERRIKDKIPDWKVRLRETDHKELAGKVLRCFGKCYVYRGIEKADVQHLSRLKEGDEIITDKNSMAWVFMMDGSLMRISPETSVSIQEINISTKEIFILSRLNQGHVFWHPRFKKELPVEEAPETDTLTLPLMVREANLEYFERSIYSKQNDSERLHEVINLYDQAIQNQFKKLNELIAENSKTEIPSTRFMLVAPNVTLVSLDDSFDLVYLPGNKSYFKKRVPRGELTAFLRGYLTTDGTEIKDVNWHEVEPKGRVVSAVEDVPAPLQILELLTRRIKTVELAREIWVGKFTIPMIKATGKAENLARNYGYKIWGEELHKRFGFLLEYTRRIETTNLRAIDNLLTKLEGKSEGITKDLSEDLYRASLNNYLLGLKSRYDSKKMRVREMSDLQYYVWILRNGKF
ncbi:MAG: hypothetical protein ACLGHN_04245 [Bacteriovoracia bacterium]